jgi:hypothetical protein
MVYASVHRFWPWGSQNAKHETPICRNSFGTPSWRPLASLLWRLRGATTMETGLFEMQADQLREFRQARQIHPDSRKIVYAMFARADQIGADPGRAPHGMVCRTT